MMKQTIITIGIIAVVVLLHSISIYRWDSKWDSMVDGINYNTHIIQHTDSVQTHYIDELANAMLRRDSCDSVQQLEINQLKAQKQ